ncbi:hypothetical protein BO71DRAFT_403826 [Aspergillus ellipticus CBS 707.79]|uniref:Uncharacterized protein n=1 Tax=Aspergillus ellipticus CBS 707.79 TaxID=1448320 RepID=A0A319D1R1_9EURO|nr:hypothetical protein BO71DRAFT_403826 [Aspergillus ellipticus CBS 707.79]
MSNIQYATHHTGKAKIVNMDLLRKIGDNNKHKAWHRSYICSGAKYCIHAEHLMFDAPEYNNVQENLELFNQLPSLGSRGFYTNQIDNLIKQETESLYSAFLHLWNKKPQERCKFQNTGISTCMAQNPVMFERNGHIFLGCPKNSDMEPWHYAFAVRRFAQIDKSYLQSLIQYGFCDISDICSFITQPTARRRFCDQTHPGSAGKLKQKPCKVRFDLYFPLNWIRFPFMILICRQKHLHYPPPPTRLPKDIADQVIRVIKEYDCLDLTTRRLMLSPRFTAIYDQFGPSTLAALHQGLRVEDRVTALIRKQRLLTYPLGTNLQGIQREYSFDQLRNSDEQWIREVHFLDNTNHFLILCCTYAQAKAFINVQHIEMDLSFKMVQGTTNVFSISAWNADVKRLITYAYVFMDQDTRRAYAIMFEKLFVMLGDVARSPVRFPHSER